MNTDLQHSIIDRLAHSQIYQDYERAFSEATGLPLALSPARSWQLPHQGHKHQNAFCALMAKEMKACLACRQTQHDLTGSGGSDMRTVTCFAGLWETAVALRVGQEIVGYLRTGEILPRQPDEKGFARVVERLSHLGVKANEEKLREAYFASPVFPQKRYDSAMKLLQIFAQHLSLVAGQMVIQSDHVERPSIAKAREFIEEHLTEDLTLAEVAGAVHMSTFYFCKQFKKETGLNFTDYLSRVRVEKAKQQLLRPHLRVSEVAYDVGFQSLTHFNRVFKKLNGQSPTKYRANMPLANVA